MFYRLGSSAGAVFADAVKVLLIVTPGNGGFFGGLCWATNGFHVLLRHGRIRFTV
jgi:hypothetical protein